MLLRLKEDYDGAEPAASSIAAPQASSFRLPLAFAIALRELRSGAGGLLVFVLCIALGVAAVAARLEQRCAN